MNPTGEPASRPSAAHIGRTDLCFAAAFALAAALVMFDAWAEIARIGYANEELGYVLIAPIIIAWIAWSRRHRLKDCSWRGGWLGVVMLLAGWFTYWYGYFHDPVIWRGGAVLALVGAALSALGTHVLRKFLPAFLACVFLIPISPNGRYRLAVPMQQATAQATQTACDILGIDVDRSGSQLTINGVDVAVAEACNGMRMILTLFMVCYVVAFTVRVPLAARLLLLLASPLVAVTANVLRLVPTVWLFGHASAPAARTFHDISGWVMIILSFLLLMGFFRLLQRDGADGLRVATAKSRS